MELIAFTHRVFNDEIFTKSQVCVFHTTVINGIFSHKTTIILCAKERFFTFVSGDYRS
jgi:hypothetical protein